jgi:hypothetical protein
MIMKGSLHLMTVMFIAFAVYQGRLSRSREAAMFMNFKEKPLSTTGIGIIITGGPVPRFEQHMQHIASTK